jgi:hypothetical protein
MRTGCGRALVVGLLLAGLLSGCATTVAQQETIGNSLAQQPEYLAHPFRLVALGAHALGNIARYGIGEPFYFLMNATPEFVGLSLEERQYIQERQDAWARWYDANIADYNIPPK